ncbi:uncharacterized protein LOC129773838 [Toxorhynchites rutilus septentrionalis]|uniref:uncharacterized protein LOC129773838 n=1 Tax=Toxorhynchites rutilus septentrionalis TaxID=329112 RepID=UPI00247A513A|nr:uncharacterized protein LOC129773838 [Toxorhynchites rutilus septentrionalis]
MDPKVKPVFQPIRRIPIPLEEPVNRKLEQLLNKDIIEVKQGPASWVSPLSDGFSDCKLSTISTIHISGERNLADVLSRLSTLAPVPFDPNEELFIKHVASSAATSAALRWEEVVEATKGDPELQEVLKGLDNGSIDQLPLAFRVIAQELCRFGDILLRTDRIVVPNSLRDRVIRIAHEGHLGMRTMKSHLRGVVWWPKMDTAVEAYVKKCRGYLLVSTPDPPQPMVRKEMPNGPWEDIAIDFLGPLPNGETLLGVVDYYSRYIEVCEMQETTAKHTIEELSKIFSRFGIPVTIRSDNGPQFSGSCEEFRTFCNEFGIRLINTIPYWPQQNGEVEGQNRSLLKRMRIAQELGQSWRYVLCQYILSYHATPHSTTGRSPSELMFGRKIRSKLPRIQFSSHMDEAVRDYDKVQKEKGRIAANLKRRARFSDIEVGDRVLMRNMRKENKLSAGFKPEEFVVIRRAGADTSIRSTIDAKEYRRNAADLKRIEPAIDHQSIQNESSDEHMNRNSTQTEEVNYEQVTEDAASLNEMPSRSKRVRTEPRKLLDYIPY